MLPGIIKVKLVLKGKNTLKAFEESIFVPLAVKQ